MRDSTPFLTRLDLDASADARAIRRAYARELKLIDQQSDPAGFQVLRLAYETALRWSERPAGDEPEQEDEPPFVASAPHGTSEPVQAPAPLPRDPSAIDAEAAFAAFTVAIVPLRAGQPGDGAWDAALQRTLGRGILLNLEARTGFEAHIVRLLLDGWKGGNEHLFAAAAKAFGWEADRQHLQLFGYHGAVLNRAIDEQQMFDARDEPDRSNQRRVLRQLRAGAVPEPLPMRRDMVHAERMMERYPSLMPIIADMALLGAWRERYQQAIGELPDTAPPPPAPEPDARNWRAKGVSTATVVFLLFQLLRMCGQFNSPSAPSVSGPPPSSFPRLAQPGLALPSLDASKLTNAQIMELLGRVNYHPGPNEHKRVAYDVTLGGAGGINQVRRTVGSGDARFDSAVEAAIRDTPPFPASAPRSFTIDIALDDPGVAHALGSKRTATAVVPLVQKLSQVQVEEIGHRIDFKLKPDSVPGDFRTQFKVTLDASGAVTGVELVHGSGDHRYDRAVEMALRQTKPFGPGHAGTHTLSYGITITSTKAPGEKKSPDAAGDSEKQ